MLFISELTYSHKIRLDDEYLTFELRDAVEKVRVSLISTRALRVFKYFDCQSCMDDFTD